MSACLLVPTTLAHGQIPGQHVLIFPQIVYGGGWFTSVLVTNVTDTPQEFTHGFTAPDGSDLYLTITVPGPPYRQVWGSSYSTNPVPPKGSFLVILRSFDQKVTTGWMNTWVPVVNGKDALKVQVTYFYAPNGVIEGQAAVIPAELTRSFSFQAVHSGESSDTGFAIVNWDDVPAIATMNVRNMSGAVVATVNFTIPPGGQVAKFVTELAPALKTGWNGGLVEFSSDHKIAGMSILMNGGVFSTGQTF
ncbi:MAG: hypothetical protein HYS51_01080 [Candidatus Zambryskibacteria bacterium]|nr:hypothetical protein [Candidatus Zambryskibacteria bacterium]